MLLIMQTDLRSDVLIRMPEISAAFLLSTVHSKRTGKLPLFRLHIMSRLSPSPRSGGIKRGCKTGGPLPSTGEKKKHI